VSVRRGAAELLLALALAGAALAEPHNPYLEGADVIGVDGMPAPPSVEERVEEIRRRLQAALVYPPIARKRGLEGVTRIRFTIGPSGLAEDVETTRSSGHAILDHAAERCARDAGRLPRVLGRLDVPIRFAMEDAP
jgi:TonB family protein